MSLQTVQQENFIRRFLALQRRKKFFSHNYCKIKKSADIILTLVVTWYHQTLKIYSFLKKFNSNFQPRQRNILGVGDFSRHDQMWFFTLNYANGPGHFDHIEPTGGRRNPRGQQYMDPQFRQPSTVYKELETHSGEDVGVYANGPFSHVRICSLGTLASKSAENFRQVER